MFDLDLHVYYLNRGLLTAHEFCMLQSLDYYREEYQHGALVIIPGNETIQRAGRCHVCGEVLTRGAPKFWSHSIGWVHFDKTCTLKIRQGVSCPIA